MIKDLRSAIGDALRKICNAAANLTLYSPTHSQVSIHSSAALVILKEVLEQINGELSLVIIDNELFFSGKPLERSASIERFCSSMNNQGFSHVVIKNTLDEADISVLVGLVAHQGIDIPYGKSDIGSLSFSRISLLDADQAEKLTSSTRYEELSSEVKEELAKEFGSISSGSSCDIKGIVSLVSSFISAFRHESNPLLALAPLRMMDEYTFTHSIDVSILNIAQGMSLGIDGQQLHDIGIAGMLHDIGKMQIDHDILNKAGKLDEAEWDLMRRHPVIGANYLLQQPGIPRMAVIASFEHHMKHDLSGYPSPPSGWKLSLCTEITMISDCFDALRTRRVYKSPVDFEESAGIMLKLAGNSLNPALTVNFIKLLRTLSV